MGNLLDALDEGTGERVKLSIPTHIWRKTRRGDVEDPFKLVVPDDGKVYCVTYDADGIPIAWDVCGACQLHLTVCTHEIPVPPAYVEALRTGQPAAASYSPTPVRSAETSSDRYKISGNGGGSGISISDLVTDDVVAKVKAAKDARHG